MFRYAMLLALIGMMVACAAAPPKKQANLGVDMPANWSAQAARAGRADSLWWQAFGDTRLDSLIDEALLKNFTLQTAAARVDAALAQARIAGAPLSPQLSASFAASRRKQNFIGFPIPGAESRVLSTTIETYGPSLNLSWELDLWGRLRSGKSAALADAQAAGADFYGARLSLISQVCKAWFAAIEARRQEELARATVDNYRLAHEQVQERYARGLRRSLDVRLSLSNVATAEAVWEQRKQALEAVSRQVQVLLGSYPDGKLSIEADLPPVPDAVPPGLPATLISRRPDLVAAERRLAATDARVAQAKAALYPQISLTSAAGTSTNELKEVLNGDFSVWSLAGNLFAPIFQGGRLRANVQLAKSQKAQAFTQYAQTALNAYAEVETALADESLLRAREQALETAAAQAIAARELAETQYASGIIDLITMLEAQRRAYTSESQLLAVRRERLETRIDLYLALGGGFADAAN